MAFNPAPSAWLGAGYTLASHVAGFTTATDSGAKALPQLTDAEADPTTGDIRKVSFAMLEALYQAWLAQSAADRPVRMQISKVQSADPVSGIITESYSFVFQNAISAQDVAPEPS